MYYFSVEIFSATLHKCWKQPQSEFEWQEWHWSRFWLENPYPFHKLELEAGWKWLASPAESQQLAIALTVCLHQSTCVCWPSNMMSLLISCIPLMGSRGEPYPHSRNFLSCCIVEYVHFILRDQSGLFQSFTLLFFFYLFFISPFIPVCRFPPPGVICFAL